MADLISPKSLSGKYFINAIAAGAGQQALMRGRIVGPVASELLPYYLCEIYPADSQQIGITTETIMPLDQLVGVYFYEDKPILDAAWAMMQHSLAVKAAELRRQREKHLKQMQRRLIKALQANGITVVPAADIEQHTKHLLQGAQTLEALGVAEDGDDETA